MLRTAQLLPPKGLSTLGFDPTRFQAEPPACYRASWQLPGPDLHRSATTSLSLSVQLNSITSNCLDARMIGASRPRRWVRPTQFDGCVPLAPER
jgi:hypothetical protein